MSEQFPARSRVRQRNDFHRIYERGVHAADATLVVLACENGLDYPRLGLAVSRKVGPAVVRNRWKRRIREAFRRQQSRLPAGVDLVVRPRQGAEPEFAAIFRSLPKVAARAAARLKPAGEARG